MVPLGETSPLCFDSGLGVLFGLKTASLLFSDDRLSYRVWSRTLLRSASTSPSCSSGLSLVPRPLSPVVWAERSGIFLTPKIDTNFGDPSNSSSPYVKS